MSEPQETGTERCKVCEEPIDEELVIMLHGRFPMHGDCYDEVIGA